MPTPDRSDDFVWIGGPSEWLRHVVVLVEKAIDGGLKVGDGAEHAAFQPTLRELGEEALDGVEPRARGWCEVEGEALVPIEPLAHFGMLVGGVIVDDHMHDLAGGNLRLDSVEEADEFLMPVTLHVAADHRAVEDVQGSEKRRRAVALVIVGDGSGTTFL